MRNLDDSARLIYHAGQQLLWGMLGATAGAMAVVFDGRGQPRATLVSAIVAGVFALLLVVAWIAGRPRRRR